MSGKQVEHWPAWFYGPNGGREIFNSLEEVPLGWASNKEDVVEADAPKPVDGEDAWGGHSKSALVHALRSKGEKINGNTSARKLFERAVAVGAIPGYGAPDAE